MSGFDFTPIGEDKQTTGFDLTPIVEDKKTPGFDLSPVATPNPTTPTPTTASPVQGQTIATRRQAASANREDRLNAGQAINTINKLSNNPQQDLAKIDLANTAGPILGMSGPFIFANADAVSQALYGPSANPESASSMLGNCLKNADIDKQKAFIHGSYPFGPLPPEAQAKIDYLDSQKSGNTFHGFPKFFADIVTGIVGGTMDIVNRAGLAATALSETVQGIFFSEIVQKVITLGAPTNPNASDYHFGIAAQAVDDFTALVLGAHNEAAREEDKNGSVSKEAVVTAVALQAFNDAIMLYPAGRATGVFKEAFANFATKSAIKGGVAANLSKDVAKFAAPIAAVGDAVTKQTTVALAAATVDNAIEQFGREIENIGLPEDEKKPLLSPTQQFTNIVSNTGQMALGGLALEAAGAAGGKVVGTVERTVERTVAGKESGTVEVPVAGKVAEKTKGATENVASGTAEVPAAEGPVVSEAVKKITDDIKANIDINAIADTVDKTMAENLAPSENVGGASKSAAGKTTVIPKEPLSPAMEALKAEETNYQKALDEAPISAILGNEPIVPRETPEAAPKPESLSNEEVFASVNKAHGTTDNVHRTGYVFPDGSMPDMSLGHPTARMTGHADVEGHPTLTHGAARDDLINRGAVRIDVPPMDELHRGQPAIVELAEAPTLAQKQAIREALNSGREVNIEMHGRGDDRTVILDPEKAKYGMNSIDAYFEQAKPVKAELSPEETINADPRVVKAQEVRPAIEKMLADEQAKSSPDPVRVEALNNALTAADSGVSKARAKVAEEIQAKADKEWVANNPQVIEARKAFEAAVADPTQADKVAGLGEALASAQKEANMMAAERGRIRVANERRRVERRDSVNKMLREIIDALKRKDIPNEFKKPIADLMEQFTTDNPTAKTLEGLDLIRQDIENGVNPAEFSDKDLRRMGEMSKKKLRDLTHEELKAVHDAILGYAHAGRRQIALQEKGRNIYFEGLEKADPEAFKAKVEEYQSSHPGSTPEDAYAKVSEQNKGAIDIGLEELRARHPPKPVVEINPATKKKQIAKYQKDHPELTPEEAQAQYLERARQKYGEQPPDPLAKRAANWMYAGGFGYESQLNTLFGEDSVAYKISGKAEVDSSSRYHELLEEISTPAHALLEKGIGTEKWWHEKRDVQGENLPLQLERSDVIEIAGLAATGANITESGIVLSKGEPGKIYKLTDNDLNVILRSMTPEDQEWLDTVIAQGEKNGAAIAAVQERVQGYSSTMQKVYWPEYRVIDPSGYITEEQMLNQRNQGVGKILPDKSHTIERIHSTKPFLIRGADQTFLDIVDDSARYIAKTESARNAMRLLGDPRMKSEIERAEGKEFYRELIVGLKNNAGNKPVLDTAGKLTSGIRDRWYKATFGFNVTSSIAAALTNFRSVSAYVPFQDWVAGQLYFARHPRESIQGLHENSQLFRDLSNQGARTELLDISKSSKGGLLDKYAEIGTKPQKFATKVQSAQEMIGMIAQVEREIAQDKPSLYVKRALGLEEDTFKNLTDEQRAEAPYVYADYVTKRIHPSSREEFSGNMTREGMAGITLSMAQSDRNAMFQMYIRLANDIKTPGGVARMAKFLLVGVAGDSAVYTGVRALVALGGAAAISGLIGHKSNKTPALTKEEQEKENVINTLSFLIDAYAGNLYGGGDVGYIAKKILSGSGMPITMGQTAASSFSTEIIQTLQHMHTAMTATNRKISEKAWYQAIDSSASWILPLGLKVPYKYGIGNAVHAFGAMQGYE
jgi:hypothetical protein